VTTRPDPSADELWRKLDEYVLLVTFAVLVPMLAAQWMRTSVPLRHPITWIIFGLYVLCIAEYASLRMHRRRSLAGSVLTFWMLGAVCAACSFTSPLAIVWLPAIMFHVFTRFAPATGLTLSASTLVACLAIIRLTWGVDFDYLQRIALANLFAMGLIALFFFVSHRIAERLEQSTRLLDSSLQAMAQGLSVIGADGRVKLFNRQSADMNELPVELLERRPHLWEVVEYQLQRGDFGPGMSDLEAHAREYVASRGSTAGPPPPRLYQRRTRDGRHIEVLTLPMPSGDTVRTYTDVTRYEQARERAEQASREKSAALSNTSHELRTPLTAILGFAHVLRRHDPTPAQAAWIDRIILASEHLVSLLGDILDVSKIEAGKLALAEHPLDLPRLLAQVRDIVGQRAEDSGLQLVVDAAGLPDRLLGDETRLRQMLLNYLGNAIKYTERGLVQVRIRTLDAADDAVLLRFEVEDTGPGIAPEQLDRLFASFEQAAPGPQRAEGAGLGLAITRRLAELMGGAAGAESAPGTGSVFWFTARLRRAPAASPAPLAARAPGAPTDETAAERRLRREFGGARVLVAEDDASIRCVLVEFLADAGLVVETAINGREACEAVARQAFDVIVLDVEMPETGGLEAARRIRALPGQARVPIVAMTGRALEDDRKRCVEAGMDDVLTKPFEPQALFEKMLQWLLAARGRVH